MLRMESPPISKKLSWMLTLVTGRSSSHILVKICSTSVRGAVYIVSRSISGAGNALRSILPLGVNGKVSRVTKALGTMYSGSCTLRYSRNC